jgi:hypothetical protein
MAFKQVQKGATVPESPEALLSDLRNRKIQGLLAHQADVLRDYHARTVEAPDVAFQLPTGSGKTLVGLLVAEWRRRKFKQKVAYFCPTVQLANQVAAQARDYGIKTVALTGRKRDFPPAQAAEYMAADVVAVTTYSALFNVRPYFDSTETLVLDDAHAAEHYVADHWSVFVTRKDHPVLFDGLVGVVGGLMSEPDRVRLKSSGDAAWDRLWVEEIPAPVLHDRLAELVSLIDEHAREESNLGYRWSVVRDRVHACHLYVSTNAILLRPFIPPTETHAPFASAKQRIYMSATLGSGGELERLWGRPRIERLAVPPGWDSKGIGRRLFFFPERSLAESDAEKLVLEMIRAVPRALVLVPDDKSETEYCEAVQTRLGCRVFTADDLEASKAEFVKTEKAATIAANRYDGIDLRGDECRLLVVDGLPTARNMQERFLISRMASGPVLQDRILTRVTQAVGRCTRSPTDYAAVVVRGADLNGFMLNGQNRRLLNPELQAELEFGLEQAKDATIAGQLENLAIFLDHDDEWSDVDQQIVDLRASLKQQPLPAAAEMNRAVKHEVYYQYRMWKGDFAGALDSARSALGELAGDVLAGYRAYWNYLAGTAAWLDCGGREGPTARVAREHFGRAASASVGVRWLSRLERLGLSVAAEQDADAASQARASAVIVGLELQLEGIGRANSRHFDAEEKAIREGLAKDDAESFEVAQERLGKLLGWTAARERSGDATPDCWWGAGDDLCIVFEDYTHVAGDPASGIGATKVRQAAGHSKWIAANTAYRSSEIVSVLVTGKEVLARGAVPHCGDVFFWHVDEFRKWSNDALAIVRDLWRTFPAAGDLAWRSEAMTKYTNANLDPDGVVRAIRRTPLASLPLADAAKKKR